MASVSKPNFSCNINPQSPTPNITTTCEFGILAMVKNKGWFSNSNFKFEEERFTKRQVFNLCTGAMDGTKIRNLAPFEIVDTHQWEGHPPAEIKSKDGQRVLDTQPAMWDVASADLGSGERIMIVRTHSRRDDVFKITTRMNMVRQYAVNLLSPFQAELDAGNKIPAEEIREAMEEIPPNFDWL